MTIDLAKIASTGESVSIEFKEKFTDTIGKTICAFSNTVGGKVYLGIADSKTNKGVVGIERAEDAITRIEDMARSCDPAISVSSHKIDLDGTQRGVVVINVDESEHKPH